MLDTVTVLAGGYSALPFLNQLEGYVIGVNDAGLHPRADEVLSMDRLWAENRWDALCALARPAWLRRVPTFDVKPPWLTIFTCDHTSTVLSDESTHLNGTHSGFCAINRAYQMRPRRVILCGLDMARGPQGQHHWYPPYPWAPQGATTTGKFKVWSAQFDAAAAQLAEANITVEVWGTSAIPQFRRAKGK